MIRVLLSFFIGLAAGAIGIYLACVVAIQFGYEYIDPGAFRMAKSPAEYAARVDQITTPVILQLSLMGGLLCGALCGMKTAVVSSAESPRVASRRQTSAPKADPLNPEEFERVLLICSFIDLRERSPAFLQGLLVGRLADTAPDLAFKLDRFDEELMAAVLRDVRSLGVGPLSFNYRQGLRATE